VLHSAKRLGRQSPRSRFVPSFWSSRAATGHRGETELSTERPAPWNATDAWLLQNNEFYALGEALPARSTHLIERPLLLDGDHAFTSSRSICRGCEMHSTCARRRRSPAEIATALPALSCVGRQLNSVHR